MNICSAPCSVGTIFFQQHGESTSENFLLQISFVDPKYSISRYLDVIAKIFDATAKKCYEERFVFAGYSQEGV